MSGAPILRTIGHSNHSLDKFRGMLAAHDISTLVDVRSWPSSRRMPHFNRARLAESLAACGIGYRWLGKELGGKGDGNTDAPGFHSAIRELAKLAVREQAVMMCAEEDPMRCHRKHLLGKPLTEQGIELVHIRGDGSLIDDDTLTAGKGAQLALFADN